MGYDAANEYRYDKRMAYVLSLHSPSHLSCDVMAASLIDEVVNQMSLGIIGMLLSWLVDAEGLQVTVLGKVLPHRGCLLDILQMCIAMTVLKLDPRLDLTDVVTTV